MLVTVTLALMAAGATAQVTEESSYERDQEVGYCGGAGPAMRVQTPPPSFNKAGPLNMQPRWAAVLVGTTNEPFSIVAGANVLSFTINGVSIPAIELTIGPTRTAQQVIAELTGNTVFNENARATVAGGSVLIRSWSAKNGQANGTVQVNATPNSANAILGFGVGTVNANVTGQQQQVIQQAMADWESALPVTGNIAGTFFVDVAYYPALAFAGDVLASASPNVCGDTASCGGTMQINQGVAWYQQLSNAVPSTQTDLLSVVRHELGHTLGITNAGNGLANGDWFQQTNLTQTLTAVAVTMQVASTAGFDASGTVCVVSPNGMENVQYSTITATALRGLTRGVNGTPAVIHQNGSAVINEDFDRASLNVGTLDCGAHTDNTLHRNELMNPGIGLGVRREISLYPSAAYLARAYGCGIQAEFVDIANNGSENGSLDNPWNMFSDAVFCARGNVIFFPGAYVEPVPAMTINVGCAYWAVRDDSNVTITTQ